MLKTEDIYLKTHEKLTRARSDLLRHSLSGTYAEADQVAKTLRDYKVCFYCIGYRKTLESRGFAGACTVCPLHLYGEFLTSRKIAYNGCYKIGDYHKMVRAASWYGKDPSRVSLLDLIERIDDVLKHFEKVRGLLTGVPQNVP